MIDENGFRINVEIVLAHPTGSVLWARRRGDEYWQFLQGGIKSGENFDDTLYRELYDELRNSGNTVCLLAQTSDWLRYRLPRSLIRSRGKQICIRQKQRCRLFVLKDPFATPSLSIINGSVICIH